MWPGKARDEKGWSFVSGRKKRFMLNPGYVDHPARGRTGGKNIRSRGATSVRRMAVARGIRCGRSAVAGRGREAKMKRRCETALLTALLATLLVATEGHVSGRDPLGADEWDASVRLPPAEIFETRLEEPEPRSAPWKPLPLVESDETVGRNPVSGGTGWLVIFEVSFTRAKGAKDRDAAGGRPVEDGSPSPRAAAAE